MVGKVTLQLLRPLQVAASVASSGASAVVLDNAASLYEAAVRSGDIATGGLREKHSSDSQASGGGA